MVRYFYHPACDAFRPVADIADFFIIVFFFVFGFVLLLVLFLVLIILGFMDIHFPKIVI